MGILGNGRAEIASRNVVATACISSRAPAEVKAVISRPFNREASSAADHSRRDRPRCDSGNSDRRRSRRRTSAAELACWAAKVL